MEPHEHHFETPKVTEITRNNYRVNKILDVIDRGLAEAEAIGATPPEVSELGRLAIDEPML